MVRPLETLFAPNHLDWRVVAFVGLSLAVLFWAGSLAPISQDPTYHEFADQRTFHDIPHFWNVVSNLPFATIGIAGCWWLLRAGKTSSAFSSAPERYAYVVFFGGEILTCVGSAYYHADPSNATLVWDRLVFSLMLTSMFTIVVTEFVHRRIGVGMLTPMVMLGLFSVGYWARSEDAGYGDLRLYFLVQFYPMLAIPAILMLFRSRYTHAWAFGLSLGLYAVAKAAEIYDGTIFEATGIWSGHTVKHLVAAAASYVPLAALRRRSIRTSCASGT